MFFFSRILVNCSFFPFVCVLQYLIRELGFATLLCISKTGKELPCGTLEGNVCLALKASIDGIRIALTIYFFLAYFAKISHFGGLCCKADRGRHSLLPHIWE